MFGWLRFIAVPTRQNLYRMLPSERGLQEQYEIATIAPAFFEVTWFAIFFTFSTGAKLATAIQAGAKVIHMLSFQPCLRRCFVFIKVSDIESARFFCPRAEWQRYIGADVCDYAHKEKVRTSPSR
ncbi:MAG: hypothetical protein KBG84_16530 [Planctomycetes bacterium]|nr:hypothetical protein [Planctomycetota bacterium]